MSQERKKIDHIGYASPIGLLEPITYKKFIYASSENVIQIYRHFFLRQSSRSCRALSNGISKPKIGLVAEKLLKFNI